MLHKFRGAEDFIRDDMIAEIIIVVSLVTKVTYICMSVLEVWRFGG